MKNINFGLEFEHGYFFELRSRTLSRTNSWLQTQARGRTWLSLENFGHGLGHGQKSKMHVRSSLFQSLPLDSYGMEHTNSISNLSVMTRY